MYCVCVRACLARSVVWMIMIAGALCGVVAAVFAATASATTANAKATAVAVFDTVVNAVVVVRSLFVAIVFIPAGGSPTMLIICSLMNCSCDQCSREVNGPHEWAAHLKSRAHRSAGKKRRKYEQAQAKKEASVD